MAASSRLGINLQEPGTNAYVWGPILNNQALTLLEEAIAGVEPVALTGNLTLTNTNFVSNQARQMVLIFAPGVGLAAPATITIPARDKLYLFQNKTAFTLTVSCGGATADLAAGRWGFIVCDGTSVFCFDPAAVSETARIGAEAARDLAVKWATLTGSNVDGSEFSSKEYAVGITAPLGSSKSWATKTGAAVAGSDYSARENASGTTVPTGSALQWATKTGSAVASAEFSAKEYAQGTAATGGTAKQWATVTGTAVAGGEYASKEYAVGDLTVTGGSAKAWAIDSVSPDGTVNLSAKSYAGQAQTAASNAGSAASSAAGFAGAASDSAMAAASAYDAFDDRYIGAKTSDPTLDNDGNPLLVGAIYFNTTTSEMRVRNASNAWQVQVPDASNYYTKPQMDALIAAIPVLPPILPITLTAPAANATNVGLGGTYTFVARAFVGDTTGFFSNYGIPVATRFVNVYEPSGTVPVKTFSAAGGGTTLTANFTGSGLVVSHAYQFEFGYTDTQGNTVKSPKVSATTGAMFKPSEGQSYEGGFLGFQNFGDGPLVDLVVAPKSTEASKVWENVAYGPMGTFSRMNGPANTARIITNLGPGPTYAAPYAGTITIGGVAGYLGAIDELRAIASKLRPSVAVVVGTPQQRFDDMLGIASVIHNRSLQTRVTPEQVVSVQKQFNAYGKALPEGASAYVDMADRAMRQVQETGPIHNATFYATPDATRNLPKGLQAIAETTGHRYFSDPKARAIETAVGFRQPTVSRVSLPANGPVPTSAPRGLLSTPSQPAGGLLSDPEDDTFKMSARPVVGAVRLSDPYGMRNHPILGRQKLHAGMDFAGTPKKSIKDAPALSTAAGTVISAGKNRGYGNRVEVDHGKGVVTSYSHLGSIGVKVGDAVRSGQEVGKVGSTGLSTGNHLHFEMSVNGKKVDPAKYVKEAVPPSVAVQSAPKPAAVQQTASARVPSTAKPAVGGLLDGVTSARPVGLLGPTAARPVPSNPKPANANVATAPAAVASIAKSAAVPSTARGLSPVDNKPTPIKGVDITGGLADRGPRVTSVSTTPQAQPLSQAQSMNLAGRLDLSTPKTAAPVQATAKPAQVASTPASALARAVSTPAAVTGGLLSANAPATGLMSAAVKTTPTALSPVSNNPSKVPTRDMSAERFNYGPQLPAMSYGPQLPDPARARVAPPALAAPSLPALPAPKTVPTRQVANVAPVDADRFGPQKAPVTRTVAPEVVGRVMSPNMAARVAEKTAPAAPRTVVSAPSFSGPGLPSVPSAPAQSKVGQLGARIGMNKGALAGSLLGSAVAGPVGGILGGMIGRSMVEGNPSRQAKAAMREGWDGFSGMSSQATAAAQGLPTGGLLSRASNAIGGLFSGGFGGSTSGPVGPSASAGSSTSGGGIGPGGSGPRDPSGNRGFAGSSFGGDKSASASNNNTSKSSASKSSSGGKKK